MSLGKSKKKTSGKGGPVLEKSELPVETDAKKLVKFVCGSNTLKEGHDIELKPDLEYPDWLWKLNIGNIWEKMQINNKFISFIYISICSYVTKVINDFNLQKNIFFL